MAKQSNVGAPLGLRFSAGEYQYQKGQSVERSRRYEWCAEKIEQYSIPQSAEPLTLRLADLTHLNILVTRGVLAAHGGFETFAERLASLAITIRSRFNCT